MPETQLRTTLTLNNGQFIAACDDSQARTGKFQNAVGGGTGNFVKFNHHMLESRRNMRLFGEAAGANLGEVSKFVHAFSTFGPVVGGAVAALLLMQEAFNGAAKEAKDAADQSKEFYRSLRDIRMEAQGLEFNRTAKELDQIAKTTAKVTEAMHELESSGWTSWHKGFGETAQEYLERTSEKYRNLQQQIKDADKTAQVVREEGHQRGEDPNVKRKDAAHAGGGAAHIMRAVHGEELGALKAEHGNPMVDLLGKSVSVQEKLLAAVENQQTFAHRTKEYYTTDF